MPGLIAAVTLTHVLKFGSVFLWSGVKFMFALMQAAAFNLGFWQSLAVTVGGGMMGVVIFAYLERPIMSLWKKMFPGKPVKGIKINKRRRMMVRVKNKYGLFGIALLTPLLLQVPIGTFLAMRFIGNIRKVLLAMLMSFSFYSFLVMGLFYFVLSDTQRDSIMRFFHL